jgi:hypothetical protein
MTHFQVLMDIVEALNHYPDSASAKTLKAIAQVIAAKVNPE